MFKHVNTRVKPGRWRAPVSARESEEGEGSSRNLGGRAFGGGEPDAEPWRIHSSHRWEGGLGTPRGQCQRQKWRGVEDIRGYPGVGVCSHWGRRLDPPASPPSPCHLADLRASHSKAGPADTQSWVLGSDFPRPAPIPTPSLFPDLLAPDPGVPAF